MIVSLYILQNIHVENIYGIEAQTYDANDRRTHRALLDCIEKAGVNDYVNNAIEFAYAKRQHGQRGKEKEYKYRASHYLKKYRQIFVWRSYSVVHKECEQEYGNLYEKNHTKDVDFHTCSFFCESLVDFYLFAYERNETQDVYVGEIN